MEDEGAQEDSGYSVSGNRAKQATDCYDNNDDGNDNDNTNNDTDDDKQVWESPPVRFPITCIMDYAGLAVDPPYDDSNILKYLTPHYKNYKVYFPLKDYNPATGFRSEKRNPTSWDRLKADLVEAFSKVGVSIVVNGGSGGRSFEQRVFVCKHGIRYVPKAPRCPLKITKTGKPKNAQRQYTTMRAIDNQHKCPFRFIVCYDMAGYFLKCDGKYDKYSFHKFHPKHAKCVSSTALLKRGQVPAPPQIDQPSNTSKNEIQGDKDDDNKNIIVGVEDVHGNNQVKKQEGVTQTIATAGQNILYRELEPQLAKFCSLVQGSSFQNEMVTEFKIFLENMIIDAQARRMCNRHNTHV